MPGPASAERHSHAAKSSGGGNALGVLQIGEGDDSKGKEGEGEENSGEHAFRINQNGAPRQ